MSQKESSAAARAYWDEAAATFDEEPDHGLRAPAVRQAWARLLRRWVPAGPVSILDAGCGTGSLSLLLAEMGHRVTGIDFSPAMVAQARAKAATAGLAIQFQVMDAAAPAFAPGSFDAVVCRHVLWALPQPGQVLRRWAALLAPDGQLILVEGFWHTGAGLHAADLLALLPASLTTEVVDLSREADYWGKQVADERYAVRALSLH